MPPGAAHDVMSYCSPEWISDHNYREAQDFLRSHPPVEAFSVLPPGESLLVSGRIDASGVHLDPVHRVLAAPTAPAGTWTLVLDTAGGTVSVPFDVEPIDHEDALAFAVIVPDVGAIHALALDTFGTRLFETPAADPHAPAAAPQVDEGGGKAAIRWDATTHPYAAIAHVHEGARTTIALALRGGEATLPTAGLPQGGAFEISLSDGLNAQRFELAR